MSLKYVYTQLLIVTYLCIESYLFLCIVLFFMILNVPQYFPEVMVVFTVDV